MATPTVPTVPFPTEIDNDDDDDDDLSSLIPPPAASTPAAAPSPAPAPAPPPAVSSAPGAPSASVNPNGAPTNTFSATGSGITGSGTATPTAGSLPSGLSTPSPNSNDGLSDGAKAGLGVGVAIGVILMALVAFFFVWRRRNRQQQKHKTSRDATPDVETARAIAAGPDVRAYRAPDVPELPIVSGAEKYRYYNELASPVVPQEVHGDREFAAELPGSAVPAASSVAAGIKEGETWSPNPPTYNQSSAGPHTEKKDGARLFDDAPIDADEDTFDARDQPRTTDKKSGL